MDRSVIYTGEQGRSTDFLFAQRATMISIGKMAQAALGSSTVIRGLAVTPNSPAALNVLVGIGEIYTLAQVDATPYGSLPADTGDTIVQQGLNMAAQTISTPAPSTSGFSVVYLIECQFQSTDTNSAVLPYFNSANPQIPLNGQGGNGQPQATQRQGLVVVQAKAGTPAATGTQVAPTVDAGWTALATVTVANGQSTVTSGNIAVPAGVPQISSLLQMMQTGSSSYAIDSSASANTITVALTPPITSYVDGQPINFQAANTNNGACTINAGGGSVSLTGANGAFQGGEIVAGKFYEAVYRANTGSVVVIGQSGGALQVAPATQSQHALQLGQAVGRLINVQTFSTAGSSTYTPTAGTTSVVVEVIGGGGAGSGCSSSSAGSSTAGTGGAGGGYARSRLTTGFSGVTVTVGAAGAASFGGAGGNGGTSSFGALLSATGGNGGTFNSINSSATPIFSGTSSPGAGSGGNVENATGANGGFAIYSATAIVSGYGGASRSGGGAGIVASTGSGLAATSPGSGGGGAGAIGNQSGQIGGNGAAGKVIVWEYS